MSLKNRSDQDSLLSGTRGDDAGAKPPVQRNWTERFSGPVKYRRYTCTDAGGRPRIFFKFDLPAGQDKPDPAILEIKEKWKHLNGYPTGLKVVNDRINGRVWRLPDNEMGRAVADFIDVDLFKLAHKMEGDQSRDR